MPWLVGRTKTWIATRWLRQISKPRSSFLATMIIGTVGKRHSGDVPTRFEHHVASRIKIECGTNDQPLIQKDSNAACTASQVPSLNWTTLVHSNRAGEKKLRRGETAEIASSREVANRDVYISTDTSRKLCTSSLTALGHFSRNGPH